MMLPLFIQPNILSLSLLLPVIVSAVLAIEAWRPRYAPRGKLFSLLMLAIAVWSAAYSMELASTTMDEMRLWLKIEYIAIPFVSPLMLLVVLQFAGIGIRIKWHYLGYLFVIPAVITIMSITNEHHHLYYTNIQLRNDGPIPLLELSIGPFYYLHVIYAYILNAYSLYIVIQKLIYQRSLFRNQLLIMLIAVLIPLISFTLYFSGLMPIENIDPTPFAFTLTGIAMAISIMKFRMLDLMPIAREHVFQSMNDGLVVVDTKNRMVDCNPVSLEIFGWPKTPYGQNISELWSGYPPMLNATQLNSNEAIELSISHAKDDKHYLVSPSTITNHKQRTIGKLLVIHDITQRYKLQQNLRNSEEKLRELNAEKDKLFSVLAHDLRGPIGTFMGFTELFMDESVGMSKEEVASASRDMHKSAASLYGLLENLLTWSRMQRDDVKLQIQLIQLRKAACHTLDLLRESANKKQLTVENNIPENILVAADENMLQFIFRNLLSNAIKFTPQGGKIKLQAQITGSDQLTVEVIDNGIGMDEEAIKTLYSLHGKTGRPGTDGEASSGLGLILVKEFVEKQGGSIQVESEVGKGSTFSFSLPVSV
jgi:PAS domain S-box-containing protein